MISYVFDNVSYLRTVCEPGTLAVCGVAVVRGVRACPPFYRIPRAARIVHPVGYGSRYQRQGPGLREWLDVDRETRVRGVR